MKTKTRALILAISMVVGTVAALPGAAPASSFAPRPKAAKTDAAITPVQDRSDCGQVKREMIERAERGDRRGAICHESRPPDGSLKSTTGKVRRLTQAKAGTIVVPEWCYGNTIGHWGFWHRRYACRYLPNELRPLLDWVQGVPVQVGAVGYAQVDILYASPDEAKYYHQQVIVPVVLSEEAATGVTVAGSFYCEGWCTYKSPSNYPLQPLTLTTVAEGQRTFGTTATAAGAVGTAFTVAKAAFGKSGFTMSEGSWGTPNIRCDNALPGVSTPGCVFNQYTPTMHYSLTTPYPQLAKHIQNAQQSGLPGAPGGTPLNRLTDQGLRDKNGDTACVPSSSGGYPRPDGHDCDEYPFRSTWQGAYTGNPGYPGTPQPWPARTFPGCQINEPPGTGPDGYSVCMIDSKQNQQGGSALNNVLYVPERVINHDAFFVEIIS